MKRTGNATDDTRNAKEDALRILEAAEMEEVTGGVMEECLVCGMVVSDPGAEY